MGTTVLPSSTTGSVMRAVNWSPDFELTVVSVFSSFIFSAVPVGREVCAQAAVASSSSVAAYFFIHPPESLLARKSLLISNVFYRSEHPLERGAVVLVCAAVDVAQRPTLIHNQGR